MEVKKDIYKTISVFDENPDGFCNYGKVYRYTTENIKEYFKYFDFENASVLSVCSSGDQAINAFLKGNKDIDLFDINKLTKYYTDLKIAAIKSLEYDDFFKKDLIYSQKLYYKIREYLSHDSKYYWDILYKFHFHRINSYDYFNIEEDERFNIYHNKNEYKKLKEIIYDFKYNNFYHSNLLDINKCTNKKYDLILLSNISNYILFSENKKKEALCYNNFINYELSKLLNSNGKIVLAYLYDYNSNKLPRHYNYNYQMLDSGNDKILVYQKK